MNILLQFVLGSAGTGKTEYLYTEMKDLLEDSKEKIILLIPEQSSFESERAVLKTFGAANSLRVQVLSFTRLADWIFYQFGGRAGKRLDDGGRNMLMSLALEEVSDHLNFYREQSKSSDLLQRMLAISKELKICASGFAELLEYSIRITEPELKNKIKDISLVLSTYDALVSQTYLDPLDDLTHIKTRLETLFDLNIFANHTIFIDAFSGFTKQELNVLRVLMRQSKNMLISFCLGKSEQEDQMGLFSNVLSCMKRLQKIAREESISEAEPVWLTDNWRFQNADLSILEKNIFRSKKEIKLGKVENIQIYRASNHYDEAEYAAATIRHLVMKNGYRYRDFTIIVRSMDHYISNLDVALEKWQIPFFMDYLKNIDTEPLVRLVLSVFDVVINTFQSNSIFACLKTGLFGLTTEEISFLENYTFLWKISREKWLSSWQQHPKGFVEKINDEDIEELAKINKLRKRVIDPLADFAEEIYQANGEKVAQAIYSFLEKIEVSAQLQNLYYKLKEIGKIDIAKQQIRLWHILMNILDQFSIILKEQFFSTQRYAELFRLLISAKNISSIPAGLDEVSIGVENQMCPAAPKVVFLLGLTQKEFPVILNNQGIFTEIERKKLIQSGFELSDDLEAKAVDERFLAYTSLTSSSEKLFLTYLNVDMSGEIKLPSVVIHEVKKILPDILEENYEMLGMDYFSNAEKPACERMAQLWREDSVLSVSLQDLFQKKEAYSSFLNILKQASLKTPLYFENKQKAKDLFSRKWVLSASQIESYHLCHFQYFCRYVLQLKERKTAEMNTLAYGNLIHFLLEYFFKNIGSKAIVTMTESALKTKIQEQMQKYIQSKLGGMKNKSQRFLCQFGKIADSAQVVLRHIAEEVENSDFQPHCFEAELTLGGDYAPLKILGLDGGGIWIQGKIDRVDIMEKRGEKFVRILDYKTGSKKFHLEDILSGINLQMLIYLAAVLEKNSVKAAGVLYIPATRPSFSVNRGISSIEYKKKLKKELQMNGLLISKKEILDGIGEGYFNSGNKKENLIEAKDLTKILQYVQNIVKEMQKNLYQGNVQVNPLAGVYNACEYCPYFPICNHEKGEEGREKFHCDKKDILFQINQALAKLKKQGKRYESLD